MSYIRTKIGIWKVRKPLPDEFNPFQDKVVYVCGHGSIKEKDILKSADTIEELCDEFVVENKKDHLHLVYTNNDKQAIKMVIGNIPMEEWFIYGAVWCDKGLIYVAKMNEKGELELL